MPDDFIDHIAPIQGGARIDRLTDQHAPPPTPGAHAPRSIVGRVIAVHRRSAPGGGGGQHLLDVTVGGDAGVEIVLRVPPGVYDQIEGKRAVIYIDE